MKNNSRTVIFIAVCLLEFAANFANALQGVLLTEYINYYGLVSSEQGLLGSFQSAGCLLACVVILLLAGRVRRFHLLIFSGGFMTAAILLIGLRPVLPILLLLYLMLGVGYASASNLCSSLATTLYPGSSSAMGMVHAFFGTGGLIAPLILRAALRTMPWNRVAVLDGIVVLAVLLFYLVVLFVFRKFADGIAESRAHITLREIGGFFTKRRNLLLLLAAFGYQGFQNGVSVWMIRFSEFEMSAPAAGAVILSTFWIGNTIARLTVMRLKVSMAKLLCYGCLISGAALLAAVLLRSVPFMFVAIGICGITSGASVPQIYLLGVQWNEGNSLLPTSVCGFFLFISILITSPITAFFAAGGLSYGMMAVAVYALAGGAALLPEAAAKQTADR